MADIISTDQHNTEARSPHELLQRQKIGAQIVVETLEAHGVTHVFGIPGAKIDAVFNTLVDSKIKPSCAGTSRTQRSSPEGSGG